MADTLLTALRSIQGKIKNLELRLEQEKEANTLLSRENENLRRELHDKEAELEKAKSDAEFLIYSHRLAENPDSIVETRMEIARLIRNIDRCINMLKD